jgi:hypothetical protein
MKPLRWVEAVCGVLASILGLAMLAYLLFVPVYRGTGCTTLPGQPPDCTPTYAPLLNGAYAGTQIEVGLAAALLVALGIAAVWHVRTRRAGAQVVLCVLTGVLLLCTLCSLLLVYGVLLPAVALAGAACVASLLDVPGAAA